MLLKSCNRCGKLIPYGAPYCSTCGPIVQGEREARLAQAKKEADKRYNAKRDPKYVRFYNGKDWPVLSGRYAQDRGYRCEICGAIATQVHHKTPIQTPEGWERRLDYDNLELLCLDCHNKRHERFQSRKKKFKNKRLPKT